VFTPCFVAIGNSLALVQLRRVPRRRAGYVIFLSLSLCLAHSQLYTPAAYALGVVCSTSSPMFSAQELAQQAKASNVRPCIISLRSCRPLTLTACGAQAKFVIVNRALEDVAIEAAEAVGIDKSKVYTMGGSTEPAKLKSIK
jgi:hypothetical protein